ncbi:MAG: hypothetical protein ACOX21_08445 [Bacillota bacterium]|nr:hypothetical protein [Bacillota bacterium]HOC07054.1 hypothetical protein [Bacillota bacterium]HPZ21878.1 hypothetical protein [Bacillota bacterium]
MKIPNLKGMMPLGRKGMGTTAKVLFVALPVIAFFAGTLLGSHKEGEGW